MEQSIKENTSQKMLSLCLKYAGGDEKISGVIGKSQAAHVQNCYSRYVESNRLVRDAMFSESEVTRAQVLQK